MQSRIMFPDKLLAPTGKTLSRDFGGFSRLSPSLRPFLARWMSDSLLPPDAGTL